MSQSDYIKYKKMSTVLSNKKHYPPVLNSQDYTNFKQYGIENTIPDTKLIENSLIPSGSTLVFDMLKVVSSCPTVILCSNTNARPWRVPMSKVQFTPKYVPKYVKHPHINQKSAQTRPGCSCIVNRKFSNSNHLNAKTCLCPNSF